MYIIGKNAKILNEANEKALTPVCTVHMQKIFALLHAKAVVQAESKGCRIENTAADGNDPKTAVFHSAGEHMIVARPKDEKEGAKISFENAKAGIFEYIKVFCGEDVAKKIKDDEYLPLSGDAEPVEESMPSFSVFLSESAGMRFLIEADDDEAGEGEVGEEAGEDDEADEMGDAEEEDEAGEKTNGDTAGEKTNGDEAGEIDPGAPGEDKEKQDKKEADAYYVIYGLKVKGLKETTLGDALKQFGSDFLKSLTITSGTWGGSGGANGELSLGKVIKDVKGIFGAISDPEKLATDVNDKLKKKFPSLSEIDVKFRDKKTLISELDKIHRYGYDGKVKQEINSADYAMVIHIKGDDVKKPFVNRKILANLVTLSISGLFKKFKNKINANNIIYLRGQNVGDTVDDRQDVNDIIPTADEIDSAADDIEDTAKMPREKKRNEFDKGSKGDAEYNAWKGEYDEQINVIPKKVSRECRKNYNNYNKKFKQATISSKKVKNRDLLNKFIKIWDNNKGKLTDNDINAVVKAWKDFSIIYRKEWENNSKDLAESLCIDILPILFESGIDEDILRIFRENDTLVSTNDIKENETDIGTGPKEQSNNNAETSNSSKDNTAKPGNSEDTQENGDDLYIIPMPGVKYDDTDDDGMSK